MTRSHIIILGCCATLLAITLHTCASTGTQHLRPASPTTSTAASPAPSATAALSPDPSHQVIELLPLPPAAILNAVTEVQQYVATRTSPSSTVTIERLRMLTRTSVICIAAVNGTSYAVTVVDTAGTWQVSDVESASEGNSGDQRP